MHPFNIADIENVVMKAADVALEHFGKTFPEGKEVIAESSELKAEKSAFSFVDAKVQEIIMKELSGIRNLGLVIEESTPDIEILAEKFFHRNRLPNDKYTLVIDPIDGSKNFLSGTPGTKDYGKHFSKFWSISVAIFKGTEPIVGVIRYPLLNLTLVTETGKGTYLNGKKLSLVKDSDYSSLDFVRFTRALEAERPDLKKIFPDDSLIGPGCFTVAFLGLIKGTSDIKLKDLELPELIAYKAHLCKGMMLEDLGCTTLAYREAGGLVCDSRGQEVNPIKNHEYDTEKQQMKIPGFFIMVPNQTYLNGLLKLINAKHPNIMRQ